MTRRTLQVPEEALEKYEEFHRHKPKRVGEFSSQLEIPHELVRGGPSKWVAYRSDKVDPETLRRPHKPVNYIHEHDAGVTTYVWSVQEFPIRNARRVPVPERFRKPAALVRLGTCLGFCFDADGVEIEADNRPSPELYCTPDGKCLVMIQRKTKVIAMTWGGALGVFARGIDG